jgi:hypothetical protein
MLYPGGRRIFLTGKVKHPLTFPKNLAGGAMKTYARCVLTGLCLVAAYFPLVWGLGMMNQPSDRALCVGLAVVLGVLAVVPGAVWLIWRRQ